MSEVYKCQYIECGEVADVYVPRAQSYLCRDHYIINCVRIAVFNYEKLEDGKHIEKQVST